MELNLIELREVLYNILNASGEVDGEQPGLQVNQQMGIAFSKAVQKDGVNIIQLQNVVNRQVISHVTLALRMLDTYQKDMVPVITHEVKEKKEPNLYEESLRAGVDMDTFLLKMERDYLDTALSLYGKRKAKNRLGLTPSRYISMRKRHGFPVGKEVGDFE